MRKHKTLFALSILLALLAMPFASAHFEPESHKERNSELKQKYGLTEVPGIFDSVPLKTAAGYKVKVIKNDPNTGRMNRQRYTYIMKEKCNVKSDLTLHFDLWGELKGIDCNGVSERHKARPQKFKQKNPVIVKLLPNKERSVNEGVMKLRQPSEKGLVAGGPGKAYSVYK